MNKFAIALTLASSLALPAADVGAQQSEQSSQQESQRQRQQQQQQQQQQQRQQREQQRQQRQQSRQAQAQQSQSPQNVLLQGRVIDVDKLDLQGHDYQHVFATIRSDQSQRTFLVDLGTQRELSGIQAEPGQQITVAGPMASFKDSPVIIAQQVRQGGESVSISRGGQGGSSSQSIMQQMQECPVCAAKAANQQQQQSQQRSSSRQSAQLQSSQQQQSVSGTLVDARSIQLRGQQDRHVLARIQTDDGRTIVADLGSRRNLSDFQPSRGSPIQVKGVQGTLNGKPILLAQQARSGDQSVSIQRSGQTSQTSQQRQQRQQSQQRQTAQLQGSQGQSRAVEGRLVSTVAMDFGAQSPTYIVGTLETQNGQRVLIDFGTLEDIQDAQLRLGEDLRAQGRMTQLNGVPVVVARQIVDDGQTITIDRQSPDIDQAIQESQSQQMQSASPQTQNPLNAVAADQQ